MGVILLLCSLVLENDFFEDVQLVKRVNASKRLPAFRHCLFNAWYAVLRQ